MEDAQDAEFGVGVGEAHAFGREQTVIPAGGVECEDVDGWGDSCAVMRVWIPGVHVGWSVWRGLGLVS